MPTEFHPRSFTGRTMTYLRSRARRLPGALPFRHWLAVHFDRREYYAFTQFLRLPTQYEALAGPVIAHVREAGSQSPLRIVVMGCSTGAEPYSIASVLGAHQPSIEFSIDAYDIDAALLDRAERAEYSEREVLGNSLISEEFVERTFEKRAGGYVVRGTIAERVCFHRADVLSADLPERIGPADLVFAQNILFNLPRRLARRALRHLAVLLKPRSAVFLDGMDLDMRCAFTRRHRLRPLDYRIEQIHAEARVVRGPRWPYSHTGLEPIQVQRKNWRRYYSTIFLRGGSGAE